MKRNPLSLAIGILLLAIVVLLLFFFQVRQSEVVVVTRFGQAARPITEPGAYPRLPWPIENVHRFDKRVQNFETKLSQGLTADHFNLLTSVYVGWRINEPTNFFPKFGGAPEPIAEAERVLDRAVANTAAGVIGKHSLSEILSVNEKENQFAKIEQEILENVRREVRVQQYGLDVEFVGFKKLALPENVTQSVFDRMTSERQVLINNSQYQGEAEAQKIRSEADRKASEMLSQAEAEATQIRAKGEAQAAESLAVFQKNPELANFLFQLAALQDSMKDRTSLIFDRSTPPFNLFNGPSTNGVTR
jgi:modulator of FtsH protease HflC